MKTKKGILADLLSKEVIEKLTISSVQAGDVFRMHLGEEEKVIGKNLGDDGRNKYFVVLGYDLEGNAFGVILIDTNINPVLPQKRKDMHYPLLASKYDFLEGINRFVDCSDLKVISGNRFVQLFGADKAKGTIHDEDLSLIKTAVASYEDASPKLLKRFGLIKK